ncbi:ArnT family glycosyltransferase [Candidatus Methylomicrobium oryzae]|jgi:4-amino-4-deoxy-L-arabinose transferase-like glycosyltransferase|uniref:ArnT family glycosyltransferase n=1 Tax=Candidatus Methylomicrobium oryzae TaxID=2802053 RepID=UPI0019214F4F|nr:glycosyltransferase family 39 protein [Methylomicrobium sp. RS1]MBL1263731.1 glycosyltransferase family 39 protein [Methylomicrobium sp. RS1]
MKTAKVKVPSFAAFQDRCPLDNTSQFPGATAGAFLKLATLWQADIFIAWLFLTAVNLCFHRLIPLDETRYASVAWEMRIRHDFLVPHLNGVPYHHKPPLLFWIDNLGWTLFGVNEIWLLLVSPLCALASLYAIRYLSGQLWPGNYDAMRKAPWLLLGSLIWGTYLNGSMFDMLLGLCVLLALTGLVKSAKRLTWRHWAPYALGCGLGLLAKGPVVLLHILPPFLLGMLWSETARKNPAKWYLQGGAALTAGLLIGLAWAVPAALCAGDAFGGTLLWHQTADRVVNSFAHRRPLWWYLEWAPVILFPWCFWPRCWQAVCRRELFRDPAVRFCAIWFFAGIIGFSAISGKQVHYLLPLMPALALLMSRALTARAPADLRIGDFLPFIVICLTGILLLALPAIPGLKLYNWVLNRKLWWPLLILATGIAGILLKTKTRRLTPYSLSVSVVVLLASSLAGFFSSTGNAFHLNDAAAQLQKYLKAGEAIAWVGDYDGQFLFLLRLKEPMPVLQYSEIRQWLTDHPKGHLISLNAAPMPLGKKLKMKIDYIQPYREEWLIVQSL